ncbi:regulator of ime2 [Hanseniaspora valbyensis]
MDSETEKEDQNKPEETNNKEEEEESNNIKMAQTESSTNLPIAPHELTQINERVVRILQATKNYNNRADILAYTLKNEEGASQPISNDGSLSPTLGETSIKMNQQEVFPGHPKEPTPKAITISYPNTDVVGHGSFGVVFVTTIEETKEKVALKKVLQDKRFKNRELEIMQRLEHRNVIDLKYYFYQEDQSKQELYLNLVLEYMPQSLYQRIRHYAHMKEKKIMPHDETQIYMYQLFKGLNYMHGRWGICHRDIKPQNILINPQTLELKICDLGSAKILLPNDNNVSYICSRYYRAPELIFGSINYTTQIDIWSAGCVMGELILGKPLFCGANGINQLVEIIKILGTPNVQEIIAMNPNYKEHPFTYIAPIPLQQVFSHEKDYLCIELLSNTLKYDPYERFNALQCLCSSYFDKIRLNFNNPLIQKLRLLDFDDENEFGFLSNDEKMIVKQKLLPHSSGTLDFQF